MPGEKHIWDFRQGGLGASHPTSDPLKQNSLISERHGISRASWKTFHCGWNGANMELNNGNCGKTFVTRMQMNRRKDTDKICLKGEGLACWSRAVKVVKGELIKALNQRIRSLGSTLLGDSDGELAGEGLTNHQINHNKPVPAPTQEWVGIFNYCQICA